MLSNIALVVCAVSLVTAGLFLRQCPAVSLALLGWIIGGFCGFFVRGADAPLAIAAWASMGLVTSGIIGWIVTSARGSRRFRRNAMLGFLTVGPLLAALLVLWLIESCPLYHTRGAGHCYQQTNVFGGWVSVFAVLLVFDILVLAVLTWSGGRRGRRPVEAVGAHG